MNPGLLKRLAVTLVAPGCLAFGLLQNEGLADEPGPLGRLFRLAEKPATAPNAPPGPNAGHAPGASAPMPPTPAPTAPPASFGANPPGFASTPPGFATPPSTPTVADSGPAPRIVPQPRVSRPSTESDPILTRVAIGRSDNGSRFGMFLQVHADGTVLDGEGVHQLGREAIRPLLEAIESSQALQLKGHCGGPPTDFIEQVHIVVYERSFGRLRANAFSFSGNPQGCEPGVRQLQVALDAIQAKVSGVAPAAPVANLPGGATPALSDAAPPPPPIANPGANASSGPIGRVIPLTPLR